MTGGGIAGGLNHPIKQIARSAGGQAERGVQPAGPGVVVVAGLWRHGGLQHHAMRAGGSGQGHRPAELLARGDDTFGAQHLAAVRPSSIMVKAIGAPDAPA